MSERNLNFDQIINRKNTKSLKYDFAEKRGYPEDILPLWVADMDFKTSSYVEDAISSLALQNIYGYTDTQNGDGFFDAVAGWMKRHHDFEVKQEWHVKTPGVCFAIGTALNAVTEPGDAVIIQEPAYYPFRNIIRFNKRKLVTSSLLLNDDGYYTMDYEDFEKKVIGNKVKLFILCSPHNPVGRVWTKEELVRIGEICRRKGVIVFSDEIHFDFVWEGVHRIFQEADPSFRDFTITATSPSKTFNLAGLQQSNIFIPNEVIRSKYIWAYDATGYDEPNIAGIAAAQAAYENGDEWYETAKKYIFENICFADTFVKNELPGVHLIHPQGTYLIWLDFRQLRLSADELEDLIVNKAGLWLDRGRIFGKAGEGFERMNTACPKSILEEALNRIKTGISNYG
ncbi:MAG: pyridoxal phosphate-dependent aminotransferase [Lachnospiraceae bacterium]|nr:pyridoxal phosphate-dependent aminotransferase [Lachnospiraceae bacterium]